MKPWPIRLADALLVPVLWVLWCVWYPYESVPFTADGDTWYRCDGGEGTSLDN